ncbi:ABC transporter ATP-binding protein [Desulfovibrio inopinatus]|uniref:ABC transporter ATP-binding protein n=1 Tax=Desulfovibrio inopinatus TaxID=102109 RepID=UPI00040F1B35|nr:ABC transporter ATP-binding protein [Desulfovibrio inopinatus]
MSSEFHPYNANMVLGSTAATQGAPVIQVSHVTKEYQTGDDRISVLRDINLDVCAGEIVAIMGPSGSGKSTLLFILGIFQEPTSGGYTVAGHDVLSLTRSEQAIFRRETIGYVFQSCDLLDNSTVYENLELPLIYAGVRRRERSSRIKEALHMVNLEHRIRQPSNRLSGGEKQRVAIARALVNRPAFILADEPTGQLDRENSKRIMDFFNKITEDSQTAMIVVTHDATTAERCTRQCVLADGVLNEYRHA